MKFPIFFYTLLWFPIAILNLITTILPFIFVEFHEECEFPIGSIKFEDFQKLFISLFVFRIFHFSIRKFKGFELLPKKNEPDFALALIIYIINLCSSFVFFIHVANSRCPVLEARVQGTIRILAILGIPILIYGINYNEQIYNVIIAQPVDEGLELSNYNPYNDEDNNESYSDIEV